MIITLSEKEKKFKGTSGGCSVDFVKQDYERDILRSMMCQAFSLTPDNDEAKLCMDLYHRFSNGTEWEVTYQEMKLLQQAFQVTSQRREGAWIECNELLNQILQPIAS